MSRVVPLVNYWFWCYTYIVKNSVKGKLRVIGGRKASGPGRVLRLPKDESRDSGVAKGEE